MVDKKELVNLPEWQRLRESLLGTWSKSPEDNVKKLRDFLGDLSTTDERRLRIILNYLTGTGFRLGKISHPSIQKLRTEVSVELKRRTKVKKIASSYLQIN